MQISTNYSALTIKGRMLLVCYFCTHKRKFKTRIFCELICSTSTLTSAWSMSESSWVRVDANGYPIRDHSFTQVKPCWEFRSYIRTPALYSESGERYRDRSRHSVREKRIVRYFSGSPVGHSSLYACVMNRESIDYRLIHLRELRLVIITRMKCEESEIFQWPQNDHVKKTHITLNRVQELKWILLSMHWYICHRV